MANYVETFAAKMDWGKPFNRTGKFPIDRSSMFASYADAVLYAKGDAATPDSRGLQGSSYVGQVITVFENDVVTVYKIEANRTLSEVGKATAGDGKSIVLSEDGILSLAGFEGATAGQQPRIVNKGTAEAPDLQIEWYTPDNSTVVGLQDSVGALQKTVDGVVEEDGTVTSKGLTHKVADLEASKANAADVYTKTEADALLDKKANAADVYTKDEADDLLDAKADASSVYTKGEADELLNAKANAADVYAKGDVYTKSEADDLLDEKADAADVYVKSEVYTKGEADELLNAKANAADVYTKTEIDGKLTGALHYQGTYATFEALLADITAGTITPVTGDVWNITTAGGTDAAGVEIKAGDNVIYNGTGWDVSSGTVDLSNYYTKSDVYTKGEADQLLGAKANAADVYTKDEADDLLDAKADASSVYTKTEADQLLGAKANAADVYAKSDVYTKDEADDLLDAKANAADVYTKTEADALLDKKANAADVYAKSEVYTKGEADELLNAKADASSVYTKTEADQLLGAKADAADVYTKTEADALLDKKVDVDENARLMTIAEGERLAELVKVEASETNGNIKLDGEETNVYTLPTATAGAIGGVKSSAAKDQVAVGADGVMSLNTVSGDKVDGAVAEASKVTNKLKVGAKSFDGSAEVEITAEDIPLPTSVVHKSDIATTAAVGVVKSNAAQDGVTVESDGTMVVNDISASKVQGAVAEASKVTNKLTAGGKTFDGSAAVEITAEDLGVMKTADMGDYVKFENVATADKAGVVKSSAAQDKVAVGADGVMTVNNISAEKVQGTVAKAADADKLGGVASGDILNGTSGQVKSAAAADKLAAAQDITLTGDATGTTSFDGSAAANINVTLKSVGSAGTYTKVTTDAQGRVTAGEQLAASDIPELTLAKISDAGDLAALDEVAYANLNADLQGRLTELERVDHEHENKAVLDGITSAKVTAWDETAAKIDGKADKATTLSGYGITDAYTKNEIDQKVAGAYHFMGTYATYAELTAAVEAGTITPLAGHVYNITTGGGQDMNGTTIKSGDNVAYVSGETAGWDCLGGIMDLSAYSTTEQIDAKLNTKADKTTVEGIDTRLGTAETKIGNLETTTGEHTTKLGTLDTDVTNLKNTVGDDSKGLVKAVAENTAAITVLNGEASTQGSVKQIVAASASEINTAIENITKDGGTIDTKVEAAVTAHNAAADAHADLFAAKQNKAIQAAITFEAADFVENTDSSIPALYMATKAVAGLDAAKDYAPNVSPTLNSCAVVAAAQFYPSASVNAGALTLYCVNAPTAAIVVNGTFTEIQ